MTDALSDLRWREQASLKWPDVPACYGWLGLTARGQWTIRGEVITHPGVRAFLGRHYLRDERGCWYVQNGPQRAYVDLAAAPWVFELFDRQLVTHTGLPVSRLDTLFVTEPGDVWATWERGAGLVCDRDLERFVEMLEATDVNDKSDTLEKLLKLPPGGRSLSWRWHSQTVPVWRIEERLLDTTCDFVRRPLPDDTARF